MSETVRRLRKSIAHFFVGHKGNITTTFALLLVPMLGTVALAVDYGLILTARTKAQVGADSAALQALGVAQETSGGLGGEGLTRSLSAAAAIGKQTFDAYARQNGLKNYSIDVVVEMTDGRYVARADYTVTSNSIVGDLFDQKTHQGAGGAVAESSPVNYVNVRILTDASQSMGLGATEEDMRKLQTYTSCAFVCHLNPPLMKKHSIKTRIDVLREAVRSMIQKAKTKSMETVGYGYQFALYTMSIKAALYTYKPNITELSPLSLDYDQLLKLTDSIKLQDAPRSAGNTFLNESLKGLRARIPQRGGDGSSPEAPREYVFLLTDGLHDTPRSALSGRCVPGHEHCLALVNQASCNDIKNKNVTLAVLYTRYMPIYDNVKNKMQGTHRWYNELVKNLKLEDPALSKALQDCASPGWFFPANDADEIAERVDQMFDQTGAVTSLTQ